MRVERLRALALRTRAREVVLFLIFAVVLPLGSVTAAGRQVPPRRPVDVFAYLLMGGALAVLLARRRRPLLALAGSAAVCMVYLLASYPYGPIFLTVSVTMYALAARASLRRTAEGFGIALAILMIPQIPSGLSGRALHASGVLFIAWAGWLLVPCWLGATVRLWRARRGDVRERQRQEKQINAERARRLLTEERLRFSRDVHDVVAHNLSVISLQAGVALHMFDRRPAEARQALEAIRRTSKDALQELRDTLADLRRPTGAESAEPKLDQLTELAAQTMGSGLHVRLQVRGDKSPLAPSVETSAYRIVQESLSNVMRHAQATAADVCLEYLAEGLVIEVTDDGRGPEPAASRTGHGIAGMRERACALGGWLDTGRAAGGGFRVRAWLPLREGAQ